MRVLFSVRNPWYVRHYESVIRRLCARGHSVCLVADGLGKRQVWPESVETLRRETGGLSLHWTPMVADEPWFELGTRIRQALYYLRFLQPSYDGMPMLLARAEAKAPAFVVSLCRSLLRGLRGRRALTRALEYLERRVPPSASLAPLLKTLRPDLVVVTPLIVLRTVQLDLLRLARRAGIPTVFGVASWDHLSSKGLLLEVPDRVLVWNHIQAREAVELHAVPPARVSVTGAQLFDDWFTSPPRRGRDEFCRMAGLDPARPYVLYAGSALFEGSPSEAAFAAAWIRAIRGSSDPAVHGIGLLVRPHPRRVEEWRELAGSPGANVAVYPAPAAAAAAGTPREDYFDSVRFAAAVVGLNTSAMVEAAILERPVLSVLVPEFRPNQEGTMHFRYLTDATSGLLRTSTTLEEHVAQLAAVLRDPMADVERSRRFVATFIRPEGVAAEATARVVDELEASATLAPARRRHDAGVWRQVLYPFARISARAARRRRELRHARKRAQRIAS